MRLEIFAPHWGSNALAPDEFIARVLAGGFDGVEMSLPLEKRERKAWTARIKQAGLGLIAQQWETIMHPGFTQHKAALAQYLRNACEAQPRFVNSHTGRDFYSFAQNLELIDLAEQIGREHGIAIHHEIHRARFSGHPMLLLPYLIERPGMTLTADLSHWCCACESLLEDQSEILARVLPFVRHVHARVGHAERRNAITGRLSRGPRRSRARPAGAPV